MGTDAEQQAEQRTALRRGRAPSRSGGDVRLRIIDTAELLFAQHGIDAVSIRDITTAAKSNTASIHYHFGSKAGLIAAIIDLRSSELDERRAKYIDRVSAKPTLRQVAEAMIMPTAESVADDGGGLGYIGFVAAVGRHPKYSEMVSELTDKYALRVLELYGKAAPKVPIDVRIFRYALSKVMIYQSYGQLGEGIHLWVEGHAPGRDVEFTERLIDSIVGLLGARSTTTG